MSVIHIAWDNPNNEKFKNIKFVRWGIKQKTLCGLTITTISVGEFPTKDIFQQIRNPSRRTYWVDIACPPLGHRATFNEAFQGCHMLSNLSSTYKKVNCSTCLGHKKLPLLLLNIARLE